MLDFDFQIIHRPGIAHVLPDALSRLYDADPPKTAQSGNITIWATTTKSQQQQNPVDVPLQIHDPFMSENVPPELQDTLLKRAHSRGHFGAQAMFKALFHNGHTWINMKRDCQNIVNKCTQCQRFNIAKHGFHPLASIHAELPMDHIAIDIKEFCRSTRGNHYLLVVVDVCTRFVFLRAIPDKSMQTVTTSLFKIFCDVGFPKILQSDNGSEFNNQLIKSLASTAKIDQRFITAYNPRANGLVERTVQTATQSILKELNGKDSDWDTKHRSVQFFMNIKASSIHGSTPYSLMFARPVNGLQTPTSNIQSNLLDTDSLKKRLAYMNALVYPTISQKIKGNQSLAGETFARNNVMLKSPFSPGAYVMVEDELRSSKMQPRYTGPFKVIRRNQGGAYVLKGADETEYTRPPHRLKLINQEPLPTDETHGEVGAVLEDSVSEGGQTRYLVRWKDKALSDSWVLEEDFDDLSPIQTYWKSKRSKRVSPDDQPLPPPKKPKRPILRVRFRDDRFSQG